jgi:hypothetical protein
MPTIHALYDTYRDARDAVRALERAGIDSDDISIIANRSDEPEAPPTNTAEGAEIGTDVGAIAGGAGGLLAGLGLVTIPGIGPVIGAGWLIATVVGFVGGAAAGMAVGGVVGALIDAGVPEEHAHVYAEGVSRGGTLVVARVKSSELPAAEAALDAARRIDVGQRREDYVQGGWQRFTDRPTVVASKP